jgi:hypothetical protein
MLIFFPTDYDFKIFNLGIIPQTIGNLRRLKVLDLSDNKLSGLIPQAISNMNSLEEIYLYDNNFSGTSSSSSNISYHIFFLCLFVSYVLIAILHFTLGFIPQSIVD